MDEKVDNALAPTNGPTIEEHQTNGKTWTVKTYGAGTSKPPISFMPRGTNLPGFEKKGSSRSCSECGFEAFGWSKECSKCGKALSLADIKVYSTRFCGACVRSKWALSENNIEFDEIDIDADEAGEVFVMQVNRGFRSVPTIVFSDGSTLTEPNSRDLIHKLKKLGLVK